MEPVSHLTAGARADLSLVRDDADRHDLIRRVSDAVEGSMLAYCVMDTHLHVVAEGPLDRVRCRLDAALKAYLRAFNRRWEGAGLLRGSVAAVAVPDADELARAVRYVHANPTRTQPPLAGRPIDYPWSSARAFAGLSLAGVVSVERAAALLGPPARRVAGVRPPLADIEPSSVPTASPRTLLAAAADVYGVPPWELPGGGRDRRLVSARALFVRLGRIEGYVLMQLAPFLDRGHQQLSNLARAPAVPDTALRIARTLLRDAALRHRLARAWAPACGCGRSRKSAYSHSMVAGGFEEMS